MELDDGKIGTGKPILFVGKHPWVSGENFPVNQSIETSQAVLRRVRHCSFSTSEFRSGPTDRAGYFSG